MSMIKAFGIVGVGTAGILVAGIFISKIMNAGFEWLFGSLLGIFVIAGAIALILKFR